MVRTLKTSWSLCTVLSTGTVSLAQKSLEFVFERKRKEGSASAQNGRNEGSTSDRVVMTAQVGDPAGIWHLAWVLDKRWSWWRMVSLGPQQKVHAPFHQQLTCLWHLLALVPKSWNFIDPFAVSRKWMESSSWREPPRVTLCTRPRASEPARFSRPRALACLCGVGPHHIRCGEYAIFWLYTVSSNRPRIFSCHLWMSRLWPEPVKVWNRLKPAWVCYSKSWWVCHPWRLRRSTSKIINHRRKFSKTLV